ncbi:hypothetical protein RND71_039736 [Anisodus tanguticus]|uniref:Uncharacterized protein n=1 Tax=Anisodus tanguticus TaxID=243964 RepID=A0AAE1QX61_9SOLA|nr:hypothetical protein RND71_039736 [Anisodus tanguticus]
MDLGELASPKSVEKKVYKDGYNNHDEIEADVNVEEAETSFDEVERVGDKAAEDALTVMCIMITYASVTLLKNNFPMMSLHDLVSHNIPENDGTKHIEE